MKTGENVTRWPLRPRFHQRSTDYSHRRRARISALPWDVDCGTEIRLFDPRRNPRDWTDLIRPTQCAVFLKDRTTSAPRVRDGQPFLKPAETTCIVFDHFDAAQRFCEARVQALPQLRCEIYDAQGLAHPPLLVIVHPDHQRKEDSGSFSSRTRKLIAVGLFLISGPLIWIDVRRGSTLILPTFLAFNCILAGLRFLYWDFGVKHREQERRKRLDAHRKMERGDA
jgi:hypothetical protein